MRSREPRTLSAGTNFCINGRCTIGWIAAAAALVSASCDRSATESPGTLQSPQPSDATASGELHDKIDSLIAKLAISEEPAAMAPVHSYRPGEGTPDKHETAFNAAEELRNLGKLAFPQLLAHVNDERQSVAFRRRIPHTVGWACYYIIEDAIYNLPNEYQGSFYRVGSDGEEHERPLFLAPGIFDIDTVETWLSERADMSLTQMQIEALEWLIEQENRIGFPDDEERRDVLTPLERQLARLRSLQQK